MAEIINLNDRRKSQKVGSRNNQTESPGAGEVVSLVEKTADGEVLKVGDLCSILNPSLADVGYMRFAAEGRDSDIQIAYASSITNFLNISNFVFKVVGFNLENKKVLLVPEHFDSDCPVAISVSAGNLNKNINLEVASRGVVGSESIE
jgi:hypothetical protein